MCVCWCSEPPDRNQPGPTPHARSHGEELFGKIVMGRNRRSIEATGEKQGTAKRVRRTDLQFIVVPAPRIEEQVVRVLDVAVGDDTPVWRRGLNKLPTELDSKMVVALQQELDKSGLYLDKLPDGSVALHTDTPRREGDEVCLVTGLLYDSIAGLTTFLSHGGNKVLVDRLVAIRGLGLAGDEVDTLYMAITGAARYMRHYLGVRKGGPNAMFKVQTAKGCGDGLVTCVVQTRNGVGIAAKSPIVINYGNEYDVGVATTAAASDEGDAQRFRGVLDDYFAKQAVWRAAETKAAELPATPQGAAAVVGGTPAKAGVAPAKAPIRDHRILMNCGAISMTASAVFLAARKNPAH